MLRTKRGFTLIELTIAMAIAGLIMGALGSVFYYLMVVPPEQSDRLTATNELRFALDWIQHDGVQAQEFTLVSDPYYGSFYSEGYPQPSWTSNVSYKYEEPEPPSPYGKLFRVETIDEGTPTEKTTNMTLSSHIVDFGDVSFAYDDDDQVTVNMTVILNPGTANEISETDTRYIEMRAAQ